ncbi:hypothetical protein ACFL0A_02095 [Patescibacteria group bacterium]
MIEISFNQSKLQQALRSFRDYSQKPHFFKDTKEREERKVLFQKISSGEINELSFTELIKELWAARIWSNKDYLINKIIKDNGIQKLSNELSSLISYQKTPGERYEQFLVNIKGMGPSMVTEILCHTDPKNAGIWNTKARKALSWLEVKDIPYDTYKITKEEYDNFNQFLQQLADFLRKENYKNVDLLFVDYFLWEVWDKFAKTEKIKTQIAENQKKEASRHDEIRDKIAEIGTWLGFETETEKPIAIGARIDVIWRASIANLGTVSYAFEVQYKGSIDGLLLNLQRAQTNPTMQKLIIVSDSEQIEKIQNEIKTLPENFRRVVSFWEADEVDNTYQNLEQVTESIAKLNLLEE